MSLCPCVPPGGHNPGRTYRFFQGTPLWPFGHSLSYTKFQITGEGEGEEQVPAPQSVSLITSLADDFSASVVVKNTGSRRGAKTVFAFASRMSDVDDGPSEPRDSLWSFAKVELDAGESTGLVFDAAAHDWCPFCSVDSSGVRAVRAGAYRVRIGGDGGVGGTCGSVGTEECTVMRVVLSGADVLRPL
jgi:beta-glucosidase